MKVTQFLNPGSTESPVDPADGSISVPVPNKRIARLIQLGLHAERAAKQKQMRRRMERQGRRRNRT